MTAPVTPRPPSTDPLAPSAPPGARPTSGRATLSLGWGLVLVGAGTLWLLALAGVRVPWELVLPVSLVVVGVLVLSVRRRSVGDGLVGLGIVLAIVTLVVRLDPVTTPLSAGDRTYDVASAVELEPSYALGAGTLVLDLRDLEPIDDLSEVSASVGLGDLVVHVPEGVELAGDARVLMGEVEVFGRTRGGIAPAFDLDVAEAGAPRLDLDLNVGLGRIEVLR